MANKILRIIFPVLFLLLECFANATSQDQPGFDLPQPNGCYPIGTQTIPLNDQRRGRNLLVTLLYPAVLNNAPVAPYMDKKSADALAKEWGLQPDFQQHVRPHARLGAPIAEGSAFPVVLLEHGTNVVPAIYTVLAEGLASSGFIVVATNHPMESLITAYPDGHELRFKQYWPENADRRTQGLAIYKFGDEILEKDVRFVLDELQKMNSNDDFWRGHLDLSKVGILGHSMGGATAALAMGEETRILAGVNLDGSTFPGMNADVRPVPLQKPFMFLATQEHAENETHAREYIGSKNNTYYLVLCPTNN
jgi:predicted dienelactone hydrolase